MSKILIVEDEPDMVAGLKDNFEFEGYEVATAVDGQAGLEQARAWKPDLIVLDVMLPKLSGLEVCKTLRGEGYDSPILMLTARAEPEQRIEGLETGVDDYLAKPFEPRELLLRVSNVLKRGAAGQASGEVRMGEFVFHIARGELKRDNETIRLTERERDLLRYFAQRPGMPVPRHELAKSDSGGERAVESAGATVAEVIDRLESDHSGIKERLVEHGAVRRFVNVYVNDEDIRFTGGLETAVADGDTVVILPAVAGGSGAA